jgi:hypothetical protein
MSDETTDVNEPESPFDASDVEDAPLPPLDESPYEVQPLDIEERSFDPYGFGRRDGD